MNYCNGTKGGVAWEPGGEISYGHGFGGQPAKLWPSLALLELAGLHGIASDTATADWPVSREAETQRINVPAAELVICRRIGDDTPVELSAEQAATADEMREDIEALNASVASADIRGCLAPVFHRTFRHDLRLGGRYHALGASNFQQMPETERTRITINGKPVVEVDISACNLTILLALTGTRTLPQGDLYGCLKLPDGTAIPRGIAKEWMIETFGGGRLVAHWSRRAPDAAKDIRPAVVRDAALRCYPALAKLTAILPKDLAATLPADKLHWAVGQFLTYWESRIVQGALGYVRAYGVVALPMHDALIVPASAARLAREGLDDAFATSLRIVPMLH